MTISSKLTPRQEDRRQRIIGATREIVAKHGYDGMVMSKVAEQARVSPTTLYNLFNTKDQLLHESLRDLLIEQTRRVRKASGGPSWRYLLEMIQDGARMAESEPAYAEAITQAMLRAGPGDSLIETLLRSTQREMQKSLDIMQREGELDERIDTRQFSISLQGLYWSSFIFWSKGLVRLSDLQRTLLTNFLGMLIPATQGATRQELETLYQNVLSQTG